MNYPNNIPLKAPQVVAVSKITPYAPLKRQKEKHYPGKTSKALLDTTIAKETLTYTPQSNIQQKILGYRLYKKA